jgi:hypothetical protein
MENAKELKAAGRCINPICAGGDGPIQPSGLCADCERTMDVCTCGEAKLKTSLVCLECRLKERTAISDGPMVNPWNYGI